MHWVQALRDATPDGGAMQDKFSFRFAWLDGAVGRRAGCLLAVTMCLGAAACADARNYPSLSTISGLGSILTPQERLKAVEELQKQDQAHSYLSRSADQQ